MTTESHDDAAEVGQLVMTYTNKNNRIQFLRTRIREKANNLSQLSGLISSQPEEVQALDDDFISRITFLPVGVSCDMLKELGKDLNELSELLDQQNRNKSSLDRKGYGHLIRSD